MRIFLKEKPFQRRCSARPLLYTMYRTFADQQQLPSASNGDRLSVRQAEQSNEEFAEPATTRGHADSDPHHRDAHRASLSAATRRAGLSIAASDPDQTESVGFYARKPTSRHESPRCKHYSEGMLQRLREAHRWTSKRNPRPLWIFLLLSRWR